MRAAILQMCSSDDPGENLETMRAMLREAAQAGAQLVLSPEVSNCVSQNRDHQRSVLKSQEDDLFLAGLQQEAAALNLWVLAGSLALKADPPETRFVNRSLLIDGQGVVRAWYDKMHMFDVQVSAEETFRESAGFAPGGRAVLGRTPWAVLGMTVCYDLRFAYLYRALAQAGAQVLTVPAAFSPGTGPMHWQPLLQARAIETGCFVIAPAQTGAHRVSAGKPRSTYGHSMVIAPWGEVILDAGVEPGVHVVDLDLGQVAEARRRVPSLTHDRRFEGPEP